jgi:hypothetical protein
VLFVVSLAYHILLVVMSLCDFEANVLFLRKYVECGYVVSWHRFPSLHGRQTQSGCCSSRGLECYHYWTGGRPSGAPSNAINLYDTSVPQYETTKASIASCWRHYF